MEAYAMTNRSCAMAHASRSYHRLVVEKRCMASADSWSIGDSASTWDSPPTRILSRFHPSERHRLRASQLWGLVHGHIIHPFLATIALHTSGTSWLLLLAILTEWRPNTEFAWTVCGTRGGSCQKKQNQVIIE